MYRIEVPAYRTRAAHTLSFDSLDSLTRHCENIARINGESQDGQTFQLKQACLKSALPNGMFAQGGTLTITGAALCGKERVKSWVFSGPDSLDNVNTVGKATCVK